MPQSVYTYVDNIAFNPDIVFLQEINDSSQNSSCWNIWSSYTPICAPAHTRGFGVAMLYRSNLFNVVDSSIIFESHILYLKVEFNNVLYHLYNVLIPQDNKVALSIPANRPDFIGIVPIYNFQNGQFFFFFFFKGKNRHRPCLDLQYINFKYENCVSLAFKIAKIQGLQGALPPDPRKGLCRWIPPGAEAAPWTPGHWVSRFWISKCWQVCLRAIQCLEDDLVQRKDGVIIIGGDFNTTPNPSLYRSLLYANRTSA